MNRLIWNTGVIIFLIGVAVKIWYVCDSSILNIIICYFHFRLSKQQESIVTTSGTETAISVLPASAETEKMSSSLAVDSPPVTDDNMSMCTNVSCRV